MDPKLLAEEIARAVHARLGKGDPAAQQRVAEEVQRLLAAGGPTAAQDPLQGVPEAHPLASTPASTSTPPHVAGTERVVISANGRNRSGIVARLAGVVSEFQGDVRDISQTLVGEYFTMILVVDIHGAIERGTHFSEFRARLEQVGREIGVHVVALHDDLLSAMHSV